MTASAWDKFLLLSWKNWIIQIRHPLQTVFEILVPVTVCTLLVFVRGVVDIQEFVEDFKYNPISLLNIGNVSSYKGVNFQLAYSPRNPVLERIVNNVGQLLKFKMVNSTANAKELEEWALLHEPFASIEFEDSLWVSKEQKCLNKFLFNAPQNITELPDAVTYALRFPAELRKPSPSKFVGFYGNWATDYILTSKFFVGARQKELDDGGDPPGYITVSFKNRNF